MQSEINIYRQMLNCLICMHSNTVYLHVHLLYTETLEHPPPIRLVGGSNETEGRVEVLIQGRWGTVCDDFWNNNDAAVVCRQLGLPAEGAQALSFAHFGQGDGPIVLDNVRCSGYEAYISDCPNNGLFVHNCAHYEDAGVRCQGMMSLFQSHSHFNMGLGLHLYN